MPGPTSREESPGGFSGHPCTGVHLYWGFAQGCAASRLWVGRVHWVLWVASHTAVLILASSSRGHEPLPSLFRQPWGPPRTWGGALGARPGGTVSNSTGGSGRVCLPGVRDPAWRSGVQPLGGHVHACLLKSQGTLAPVALLDWAGLQSLSGASGDP